LIFRGANENAFLHRKELQPKQRIQKMEIVTPIATVEIPEGATYEEFMAILDELLADVDND